MTPFDGLNTAQLGFLEVSLATVDPHVPNPATRSTDWGWLNDLPSDWEVKKVKQCLAVNESNLPEATDPDLEFRYIEIGAVNSGDLVEPLPMTRFSAAPSRARKIVKSRDTIVSTVRTYLKAVWYADDPGDNLICSTGFAVLTPKQGTIPRFASYVAQSAPFTDQVTAESVGIAYPAISEKKLGDIRILLPPPDEQTAIVRFLDHADEQIQRYIAGKKRLIALLEEERQALIHQAVTRGLDPNVRLKPSGVEWLGDVPEHWEIRPLKRGVSTKITDGPHETPVLLEEGIPFMSAEAMVGGRLDFNRRPGLISREQHELCCRKCRPQINDIFMCKSGATTGKVAIVDTTKEFSIWSPLALIRVDPQKVLAYLLFEVLETKYVQQQIEKHWSYGTQPNLAMNTMERIAVMLPPIAEQKKLLTYLDKATQKIVGTIDRAPRQIELMEEYRTRVIADVVTGQLDVREAAAQLQEAPWAGSRRTELRNE